MMKDVVRVPLAAVVVGLICFSTACQTGQGSPPAATEAQGAVRPKVERLVFGIAPPTIETNNYGQFTVTHAWQLGSSVDYLIGITPDGQEMVPQLAAEWALEPDGRSYRFKIRDGVAFHGGFGTITANDVKFTWEDMKADNEVVNSARFSGESGKGGRSTRRPYRGSALGQARRWFLYVDKPG
jgi:ABC-type transport system substrate-binding protein